MGRMAQRSVTPVFVIPHFARSSSSWKHVEAMLDSLYQQVDPDWEAVVVDDASPDPGVARRLADLAASDPQGRVSVVVRSRRGGPGAGRNDGVQWAAHRDAPFVLFQDSDDVAHPERLLHTRRLFEERHTVDMVYSSFVPIDDDGEPVPLEALTPSIREILESHKHPVEGPDAWIPIGVDTGYTTLTSTVAVRTALAIEHPFPHAHAAEDDHTWFRLLAAGGELAFLPGIEARYRVPRPGTGSASREEHGTEFYLTSALMTAEGFDQALAIAARRGVVNGGQCDSLRQRFLLRLAVTTEREGLPELAEAIRSDRLPKYRNS